MYTRKKTSSSMSQLQFYYNVYASIKLAFRADTIEFVDTMSERKRNSGLFVSNKDYMNTLALS